MANDLTLPRPCSCHNFCNGEFIGCDTDYGDTPCVGELVCGCHAGDLMVEPGCTNGCGVPPTTPTVPIPSPVAAPLPTSSSSVENPHCLECPANSYPLNGCVTSITEMCVCNEGFFKSSPTDDAPCIPCLSCGPNGYPKTNCVQDATDPNQCGCDSGYMPNGAGGCVLSPMMPAPVMPVAPVPQPVAPVPQPVAPVPAPQGTPPAASCLSCPLNSYATTSCVTSVVNQCVCNQGFFQPTWGAPCDPCLTCGANSYPLTNCVRDIHDPSQCGCDDGYARDGSGSCAPVAPSCLSCGLNEVPTVNCVKVSHARASLFQIYTHQQCL